LAKILPLSSETEFCKKKEGICFRFLKPASGSGAIAGARVKGKKKLQTPPEPATAQRGLLCSGVEAKTLLFALTRGVGG